MPSSTSDVQLSFAPVVKRVAPAVVNVYSRRVVQTRSRISGDPFFDFFFGKRGFGTPRQRMENSLGSGVIVGDDGVIVTNNHVIANGTEFTVVLNDRREFEAEVILADERTDLAVLCIDTEGERLATIPFADSDLAEVGDLVMAIGNPFGVGQTVTSGIVSAVARTQAGISDYQFFIQTDAAINPGNSGGALVNSNGELIGINTAIYSRSGGSIGIGFAIPSNMVFSVVESATAEGVIVRPWLGIKGQIVSSEIAESLGLARPAGILISGLHPDSPARKSGLKTGDIIIAVDDFEVDDVQSLNYRVATRRIGETARFRYLRGQLEKTASVTMMAAPEVPPRDLRVLEGDQPLRGVSVANLSPAVADEYAFDWDATGVVIVDIARGSFASRYGFQKGDIIESVNGAETETVDELVQVLSQGQGAWRMTIRRGGRVIDLTIRG